MGILNSTPDSFYDGHRHHSETTIFLHVERMLQAGATIIVSGGMS